MAASQSVNQNTYSKILRSGSAWIYRNNKIISNSDQYGEKWDIFLIIFFLSKINIIYIFTTLFKLYNISCNLVFTNLQKKKNDRTN